MYVCQAEHAATQQSSNGAAEPLRARDHQLASALTPRRLCTNRSQPASSLTRKRLHNAADVGG